DVALYVVLAIAVGIASASGGPFGLPALLGLRPGDVGDAVYHVLISTGVLWLFLVPARHLYRRAVASPYNVLQRRSAVAPQMVFMLPATAFCLSLGIQPFFGAFLAGVSVGTSRGETSAETGAIQGFSFAFFVPLYFGLVGFQLNLLHGFSVVFFLAFLVFAC